MKRTLSLLAAILFTPSLAFAALEIGKPAPDFTAKDIHGVEQSISGHKGKIIVLEWNNPGCPFVVKHYGSKNMQNLQAESTKEGAIWLTINSGAAGKQGAMNEAEAKKYIADQGAEPTGYILDADGKIGKLYDASTTPHMFVIGKDGELVYAGAIDDNKSADQEAIKTAKNYVSAAILAAKTGHKPEVTTTQPYGCSVKYAE
jgi:hypothetical protein